LRVFVENSAWFAAVPGNDIQHERAKTALGGQVALLTLTLVLAEA
jgi:hypothetical protein